jgi:hypothetical protein
MDYEVASLIMHILKGSVTKDTKDVLPYQIPAWRIQGLAK